MGLVSGWHLGGVIPQQHENGFTRGPIASPHMHAAEHIVIDLQPGDPPIFNAMLYNYASPSTSKRRAQAPQFHFREIGAVWREVATERRLLQLGDKPNGDWTIPRDSIPRGGNMYRTRPRRSSGSVESLD
jgi:hypothetical protein